MTRRELLRPVGKWWRPSNLGRLDDCPGSGQLEDRLRADGVTLREESDDASEGTMLHECVAQTLKHGKHCYIVTREQQDVIDACVTFFMGLGIPQDAEVYTEDLLTSNRLGISGTADVVALFQSHESGVAEVPDWKMGRADLSEDHATAQLTAYALLVLENFTVDEVRARICQPRLDRRYLLIVTRGEQEDLLIEWLHDLRDRVTAPDAPLRPSPDACRYCPCLAHCPAAQEQAMEVAESREQLPSDPRKVDAYYDRLLAAEKAIAAKKEEFRQLMLSGALEGEVYGLQTRAGGRSITSARLAFSRLGGVFSAAEMADACSVSMKKLREMYREKRPDVPKAQAEREFYELLDDAVERGPDTTAIVKRRGA